MQSCPEECYIKASHLHNSLCAPGFIHNKWDIAISAQKPSIHEKTECSIFTKTMICFYYDMSCTAQMCRSQFGRMFRLHRTQIHLNGSIKIVAKAVSSLVSSLRIQGFFRRASTSVIHPQGFVMPRIETCTSIVVTNEISTRR